MKNIKKILILRFGVIGDVVHSTALFRALKKYDPSIEIHYMTYKVPSLPIENDPDLDKIWVIEAKTYKYLINYAKELKKEKFDLFINLQPSIKTKFLSLLVGAKYNLTYKKTFKLHAVENFWRTAKPLFSDIVLDDELQLFIPDELIQEISTYLNKEKKVIALNIGASGVRQGRKLPLEYWIQLAKMLVDDYEIILSGAKEDTSLVDAIVQAVPEVKSFCGKFNIKENAALLANCDLVISSDTGPLHIATAVGTHVIGVYGAAPISRTGPYGKKHIALKSDRECVPCNRRKCKYLKKGEIYTPCLTDITPDIILQSIDKIFHN